TGERESRTGAGGRGPQIAPCPSAIARRHTRRRIRPAGPSGKTGGTRSRPPVRRRTRGGSTCSGSAGSGRAGTRRGSWSPRGLLSMPHPEAGEPFAFRRHDLELDRELAFEAVGFHEDGVPALPQDDLLAERLVHPLGPRRRGREHAAVELELVAAGRR